MTITNQIHIYYNETSQKKKIYLFDLRFYVKNKEDNRESVQTFQVTDKNNAISMY